MARVHWARSAWVPACQINRCLPALPTKAANLTNPTTKAVSRWPALIHAWRKARDAIGRPDLRWHDLRHTAVALAIANGAHLKAIQSAWVMPQ